ncbi:hypothetical protein BDF14DRAFT_1851541 [Spinellus fusiger]|nr:hypothetical protein BDF14DRAFT_1851541 [Spinellus fusiger]
MKYEKQIKHESIYSQNIEQPHENNDPLHTLTALYPQPIPCIRTLKPPAQIQYESKSMKRFGFSVYNSVLFPDGSLCSTIKSDKRSEDRIDSTVNKRQRNTDAARRSRLHKVQKREELELRVEQLECDEKRLRIQVTVLESECSLTETKAKRNQERVLELETQLAEVHRVLMKNYTKRNISTAGA